MITSPNFPKYLSVKEVASILGVSVKFVYVHLKEIPGYLKLAGKILFDAEILFRELKRLSKEVRSFPVTSNTPME